MPSLLSQKAVLASLSISQWSARKLDKKVTEEIHPRNHAEPHAGRYNKLLIASPTKRNQMQADLARLASDPRNLFPCPGASGRHGSNPSGRASCGGARA
jgi:hypothetical protein